MSKRKVSLTDDLLEMVKDVPRKENQFVDGGLVKSPPPETWEQAVAYTRDQIYSAPTLFSGRGLLLGATELEKGKTKLVGVWLILGEWKDASSLMEWLAGMQIDMLPIVAPKIRSFLACRKNGKLIYKHTPGAVAATDVETEAVNLSNRAISLLATIETLVDHGIDPQWEKLREKHPNMTESIRELQAAGRWPADITPPPKT